MASKLRLEPWRNHREAVLAIEVTDEQRAFLGSPSVAAFVSDDGEHPTFTSYAICRSDEVVGFVSYGQEVDHEAWRRWIPLVVIDRRHQRRGYGRAAMELVIAHIQNELPEARAIGLSCKRNNVVAWNLYRSLGFAAAEDNDRGGVDMWLTLDAQ